MSLDRTWQTAAGCCKNGIEGSVPLSPQHGGALGRGATQSRTEIKKFHRNKMFHYFLLLREIQDYDSQVSVPVGC